MSPTDDDDDRLFKLGFESATGIARRLVNRFAAPLESLLGVDRLNETYQRCRGSVGGLEGFLQRVLDELHVSHRIAPDDVARIPKSGPLLVVANHPFGA